MSILVWYLLLFTPQLVIGAVIGWWVGQQRRTTLPPDNASPGQSDETEQREQELRNAMSRLKQLTASVKDNVHEHARKVDSSSKELADLSANGEAGDPAAALSAIAPIVEANEELQRRLAETEQKLADQAEQLDQRTVEALTDPLTGLLNRRGMEDQLFAMFDDYGESGRPFCLMFLDVDHFKQFNDDYGHDVGDVVLRDVARVASGSVRTHDVVARFGGEEFIVLLPDSELHDASDVAEQVRAAVERNAVRDARGDLKVTISLGVAQIMAEDTASLLKRADLALYAAKEAGRNRAFLHDGLHAQPLELRSTPSAGDERSDTLTQLPSRHAFTEELTRRVAESGRNGGELSLITLEVDGLPEIAAEHGESTANLARRGVAGFLSSIMRDMDLVARDSEDSFCILLPGCALADAMRVAERVRSSAAETPFRTETCELNLTLSAGVASTLLHETAEALMERGRKALERCRALGTNRVFVDESDTEQVPAGPVETDEMSSPETEPPAELAGALQAESQRESVAASEDASTESSPLPFDVAPAVSE